MKSQTEQNPECCPEFDPLPWDDKTVVWENKKFIKDKVFTLFYMPVNFGRVMKRLDEKLTKAGAAMPDNLGLSDHTSKWNMNIYLAVDKPVPDTVNTTLSGKFYSKVYEGSYQETGKWMKDFENTTKNKGLSIKKEYMWYTTCPKCAKKYGKNYVVVIGQVE
jgi:hypothetical protein